MPPKAREMDEPGMGRNTASGGTHDARNSPAADALAHSIIATVRPGVAKAERRDACDTQGARILSRTYSRRADEANKKPLHCANGMTAA